MPAGLPVAIALLAQAASAAPDIPIADPPPATATATATATAPKPAAYGPVAPAAPKPAVVKTATGVATCDQIRAQADAREIVVCAQQGYRLNPDVLEAKRELHNGGPPRSPENFKYNDCAVVGPMGCAGQGAPGINLIAAAATLASMASRLSKGQEIGSMFITDPHPNEYQLYLAAKHRREAKEAEAAAAALAAAARAKAKAATPAPGAAVVPTAAVPTAVPAAAAQTP